MGWMDARYQIRHRFLHNTAVDLTGGAADVVEIPVVDPKIEVIGLGLIAQANFPDAATMTMLPVVAVDKVAIADGTRTELGTISPDYEQPDNSVLFLDLDPHKDDNATPAAYPTAVMGDVIVIEHKTAGVGGTQSAKMQLFYRELQA